MPSKFATKWQSYEKTREVRKKRTLFSIFYPYQPFGQEPFELTFHPQFLKEYNGRWFVFGEADREPYHAYNVPLDRIVGCAIVEYEQKGSDRAKYGDRLLKRLEEKVNTRGLNVTLFKISRNFYLLYPQIGDLLRFSIRPTASDELGNNFCKKGATASHQLLPNVVTQKSSTLSHQFVTPANEILRKLSFSHIREIMTQDDPLARFFLRNGMHQGHLVG